jgi:hypothetical protein
MIHREIYPLFLTRRKRAKYRLVRESIIRLYVVSADGSWNGGGRVIEGRLRIRITLIADPDPTFHLNADPDPADHKSDLQPLLYNILQGSILSLHASIVSVHGFPVG